MNKLGVLSTNIKTYFMRRLIEEVGDQLVIYDPFDVWRDDVDQLLVRTTGVHREDHDLRFLEKLPQRVLIHNPMKALELFRSKNLQARFFELHQIPHLPWIDLSSGLFPDSPESLLTYAHSYLVKPRRGQGGWGIEKILKKDFKQWWNDQDQKNDLDFILQPYVSEAREYRIFFCRDFRMTLRREATTGLAANFASDGKAEIEDFPAEFSAEIERLISLSGVEYGAIDLLIKDKKMIVLELNTVPGIEQAEALSGQNLMGLILNKIIK